MEAIIISDLIDLELRMQLQQFQTYVIDQSTNLSKRKEKYEAELRRGIDLRIESELVRSCLSKSLICCSCFTTEEDLLEKEREWNRSSSTAAVLAQREESETLFGIKAEKSKKPLIGSWYDVQIFEEWEDLFYNPNMKVTMRESYQSSSQQESKNKQKDSWYSKITIWFGDDETMSFIFDNKPLHEHVFSILTTMKEYYTLMHPEYEYNSVALRNFVEHNHDSDSNLSRRELKTLMKQLNLPFEQMEQYLEQIPEYRNNDMLSQDGYMKFIELIQCPANMYPIYEKYAQAERYSSETMLERYSAKYMSKSEFEKFKSDFQLEPSKAESAGILSFWKKSEEKQLKDLSFIDFCRYVLSYSKNSAIRPVDIDDSKPLPYYFVNSSHNTYLVGNQITSKSSANVYYLNLVEGMRCVELDIHDGKDGPIIKHGFTFTAPIKFAEAMKAIMKFSLQNPNHTPIILSFENHCSAENRLKMAKTLERIPFERFYVIPTKGDSRLKYPPLKSLLGKIIIQGTGSFNEMYPEIKRVPYDSRRESINNKLLMESIFSHSVNQANIVSEKDRQRARKSQRELEDKEKETKKNDKQEVKELSRYYGLVVSPFDLSNSCWQMANIAENNLMKSINNEKPPNAAEIYTYSWHSMIRIYPFGLRFDSSNFNPIPMLQTGCQLTSLNTQSVDINYVVVQGMFEVNKHCGYVLKRDIKDERPKLSKFTFVFLNVADLRPRKSKNADKDTHLQVSFLGAQEDMERNSRFVNNEKTYKAGQENEAVTISEKVRSKTLQAQLRGVPEFAMKTQLSSLRNQWCPEVVLNINQTEFANLYLNFPHCGSMSVPLKELRSGIRCIPLYRFEIGRKKRVGTVLAFVKVERY